MTNRIFPLVLEISRRIVQNLAVIGFDCYVIIPGCKLDKANQDTKSADYMNRYTKENGLCLNKSRG